MKSKKEFDKVTIALIILIALAFIINYEEPTITGQAAGGIPGPPGGSPPGQGGVAEEVAAELQRLHQEGVQECRK